MPTTTVTGTAVAELIATTRELMETKDVVDNVYKLHPLLDLFKESATNGTGSSVDVNVIGAAKSGAWSSTGSYTSAVDDAIVGRASYAWSDVLIVPTRLKYKDLAMNNGPESLAKLAKVHLEGAAQGTADLLSAALHGTGDASGVKSIYDLIAASGTVGGIDPATATWWKSTVHTADADDVDIRKAIQATFTKIRKANGQRPTHILAGLNVYEAIQDYAAGLAQVVVGSSESQPDVGFESVRVSGVEVRYDPDLDAADTGAGVNHAFFIHQPSLVSHYLDGNLMKVQDDVPVSGSLDRDVNTTSIVTFGTTARRNHGKLIWTPGS